MNLKIYYKGEYDSNRPLYLDKRGNRFVEDLEKGKGKAKEKIYLIDGEQEIDVSGKYNYIFMPRHVTKKMVGMDFQHRLCPMCGNRTILHMSSDTMKRYRSYCDGNGLIQDRLPDLNIYERELLKTGYCYLCQELLFNTPDFILTGEKPFDPEQGKQAAYITFGDMGGQWIRDTFIKSEEEDASDALEEAEEFFIYVTDEMMNRGRKDIPVLCEYLGVNMTGDQEYDLYSEGSYCNYWIHIDEKEQKYPMHIHCYQREWE